MNNSDMPLTGNAYENFAGYDGTKNTSYDPECQGLTKLEHFAGLAMQGLLATNGRDGDFYKSMDDVAKPAIQAAKALLAELEQSNDKS